jgi:hypothetical protein
MKQYRGNILCFEDDIQINSMPLLTKTDNDDFIIEIQYILDQLYTNYSRRFFWTELLLHSSNVMYADKTSDLLN